MGNKITLLTRSKTTGRIRPKNVEYDGTVDEKVWNRINHLFQDKKPEEYFFPKDPMEVYNETLALVEEKARLIASGQLVLEKSTPETYLVGVALIHWLNYHIRQVQPEREAYRQLEGPRRHIAEQCRIERGRTAAEGADVSGEALLSAIECTAEERLAPLGELRGGTPMSVRGERALNRIAELLFRIQRTKNALPVWETLLSVAAAFIVADGNMVEAAQLLGISKSTWYRKWPTWCAWFRAAAKESAAWEKKQGLRH